MSPLGKSLALCVSVFLFSAVSAFGTTVQVGTCNSGTAYTQYPTIQSALNASNDGDTVYVCPGSYPEQITIDKSVTLQGFQIANGSSLATIVVPVHGVTQNTTSLGGTPISTQVYVTGGATATISNLTVDGLGNGIRGCDEIVGIYFQNASGTVTESAVLNQTLATGLTGCQDGEGIYVESGDGGTSSVNVNHTLVENFQKNGITGNSAGTALTVSNNTIVGQGSTTGAAENGVQIGFGATGTVTSNTVSDNIWAPDTQTDTGDAAAGILIYASKSVTISSNRVTNTQFGIVTVSDPTYGKANATTITLNTVNATHLFDAIDVCSNNNSVTSNTIYGADESGIHLDDTCGTSGNSNTVTGNTVSLSCAGILAGPSTTGNNVSSDTFYNAGTQILSGDTCFTGPAPALRALASLKRSTSSRFQPVRP